MWPQWTSMLSPWQWGLLALVPPAIVALYFLKLRRQPLEVPSTYLWHRSLEDLHVNSLWQKLRRSVLLWLQLLLVGLAILALLRPSWRGNRLAGDRFVFLVDNSASMAASDVAPSRLAEAKRQAAQLIEQMPSAAVAMVVSFSDKARVEQLFTDNRKDLLRAVEQVRQTNASTSLDEALRVAAGLANPGRIATDARDIQAADPLPATLYLLSDGRFEDVRGFSLGNLQPVFMPIGVGQTPNLAITAFSATRHEQTGKLQAFARVENHGPATAQGELGLYLKGELVDALPVEAAAGEAAGATFDLGEFDQGVLEVRLEPADALALDNTAWTAVNRPQQARLLCVTPGNPALQFALTTDRAAELAEARFEPPSFLDTPGYVEAAARGDFDLVIFDRCAPKEMPAANTMFVGTLPPVDGWSAGEKFTPQIIDTDPTHPLVQLLELWDVAIVEGFPVRGPEGSKSLIQTQGGPLLAIAPRDAYEDVVLGCEIVSADRVNTNWPLRLSFPLFALNLVEYFGRPEQSLVAGSARPGQTVELRSVTPTADIEVQLPDGALVRVPRSAQHTFSFVHSDQLGVYQVRQGGVVTGQFAVNLFDGAESNLAVRDKNTIKIGYVEITGKAGAAPASREAWKWLVLAALAVLVGEWYIYNRRVYL